LAAGQREDLCTQARELSSKNGLQYSDGATVTPWRNYQITLAAFPQRTTDGRWRALSIWDDASTSTTRVIVTPASLNTYAATFGRDAFLIFIPFIAR
jgi:hypothetical protein